jgi:hypothetical protein
MTGDDGFKSVLAAIFSRKGGLCATAQLWDDWDDEIRNLALGKVQLENGELPVLLVISNELCRLILTTRQLICGSSVVALSEIVDVKPVSFTEKRKDQLNEVDVDLSTGRSIRLVIDSGPSYFAIWSILLHVAKRNVAHGKACNSYKGL